MVLTLDQCGIEGDVFTLPKYFHFRGLPVIRNQGYCSHDRYVCDLGELQITCPYSAFF